MIVGRWSIDSGSSIPRESITYHRALLTQVVVAKSGSSVPVDMSNMSS